MITTGRLLSNVYSQMKEVILPIVIPEILYFIRILYWFTPVASESAIAPQGPAYYAIGSRNIMLVFVYKTIAVIVWITIRHNYISTYPGYLTAILTLKPNPGIGYFITFIFNMFYNLYFRVKLIIFKRITNFYSKCISRNY